MSDKGVVVINGRFAAVVERYFLTTDRPANDEEEVQSPRREEESMVHQIEGGRRERRRERCELVVVPCEEQRSYKVRQRWGYVYLRQSVDMIICCVCVSECEQRQERKGRG